MACVVRVRIIRVRCRRRRRISAHVWHCRLHTHTHTITPIRAGRSTPPVDAAAADDRPRRQTHKENAGPRRPVQMPKISHIVPEPAASSSIRRASVVTIARQSTARPRQTQTARRGIGGFSPQKLWNPMTERAIG